jgi:hypothetical protein
VSPIDGRETTEKNKKEKKTMQRITNVIHPFTKTTLPLALLISFVTASPLFAQDSEPSSHRMPAKLVEDVREATRQFIDVNPAGPAGYRRLGASAVPTTGPWAFITSTADWWVTARSQVAHFSD